MEPAAYVLPWLSEVPAIGVTAVVASFPFTLMSAPAADAGIEDNERDASSSTNDNNKERGLCIFLATNKPPVLYCIRNVFSKICIIFRLFTLISSNILHPDH
jgi:hypothetical protein